MSTAEGAYRCAECKSLKHLVAWAAAVIEGPLNERGELISYDYVDDCYLHEDSIHCTRHMDAGIELFQNGRWCRWWSCPKCKGSGRVGANDIGSRGGYACSGGIEKPANSMQHWYGYGKTHKGWLPASEVAVLLSAEG